jgi:copper transport outer membrane protein MctB
LATAVFDFRYHALSLAAVLIALMVGLLLGVAIGDAGLVSSQERNLRENLKRDVRAANRRADELRRTLGNEVAAARAFEDAAYPLLVGGRLRGARLGLVFMGRPSEEIARHVRAAVAPSGGEVVLRAVVREPLDLGALGQRAAGTRYAALGRDGKLVDPFGFRIGSQLAGGGRLIAQVRPALLQSFNGALQPLDGVVVVRRAAELRGEAEQVREAFERGLVRGLSASPVPVVGIEMTTTEPSQVGWYRGQDLASVDDVDRAAGRAALIFILEGGVDGAFGVKPTADTLLPDVVGQRRG